MRLKKIYVLILMVLTLFSCKTVSSELDKKITPTRYPILLVHGFNQWTTIPYPNSLIDLTRFLRTRGLNVYCANIDAFARIEDNASYVIDTIEKILYENPSSDKINIIAYSKGGLDARYAISVMGAGQYTASLTTLSTPHHGSTAIDFFSNWWVTNNHVIAFILNTFGRMAGDLKDNYLMCLEQMTYDRMRVFNSICKDYPGVKYYSLSSSISKNYFHLFFSSTRDLIYTIEGDNDGIVSGQSAAWGEYLGSINYFCKCSADIAHTDIVGINIPHNINFDHEVFFLKLIEFLADEGF